MLLLFIDVFVSLAESLEEEELAQLASNFRKDFGAYEIGTCACVAWQRRVCCWQLLCLCQVRMKSRRLRWLDAAATLLCIVADVVAKK